MSSPGKSRVYEATCCDRVQSLWRAFSSSRSLITHSSSSRTEKPSQILHQKPQTPPPSSSSTHLCLMPLNDLAIIIRCQRCNMICFDLYKQLTRSPWDIDLTEKGLRCVFSVLQSFPTMSWVFQGDFLYTFRNKKCFYFYFPPAIASPRKNHMSSVMRSFLLSVLHKCP